jgi:hypothetical protein
MVNLPLENLCRCNEDCNAMADHNFEMIEGLMSEPKTEGIWFVDGATGTHSVNYVFRDLMLVIS